MIKKNVLWISPYVPYDGVSHAGGKIENYYIKGLRKKINVELISCFTTNEKHKIDLDKYDIKATLSEISSKKTKVFIRKILNAESTLNPFNRYGGFLQNYLEMHLKSAVKNYYLANKDKIIDVIIIEWTEAGLLLSYIKRFFPNSKVIMIEEDVAFLGMKRKVEYSKNIVQKLIKKIKYKRLKKLELSFLQKVELVATNNGKDFNLLVDNGINRDKLFILSPYFDNYIDIPYKRENNNIVFFGAMSRKENYLSAIWFINNVFPYLEDKNVNFIIIGGNPNPELLKYQSDRIKVLGFVEDVSYYLSSAMCLVAPLVLGAGIKIKILEALSAGIPVLTNKIGIEGISAVNQKDYFYCEKPGDYLNVISNLINNPNLGKFISHNAKKFIDDNYNINNSLNLLIDKVKQL